MTATATQRLLSPEEIAVQAGQQLPFLRLPERATVYAEREMRLRQRAQGNAMRDFLLFMAEVAQVQHALLQAYPAVALPEAAALDAASRAGQPPLPATLWPRDPAWRSGFARLIEGLLPRLVGSPARSVVAALQSADAAWLDQQADRLLSGTMRGLDLGSAPLIAAALQVYFTHLVLATEAARGADRLPPYGRVDDATRCPCCASLPTASVSRIGADTTGHRYLHCALCAAQWHVVRVKCTHCQKTEGIHYQSLRAADAPPTPDAPNARSPIEAETCDTCGHYLKIVRMERDPHVDPVADDLASTTLDLLVAEAGYQRHGVNLLLLYGESPGDDPGGGG